MTAKLTNHFLHSHSLRFQVCHMGISILKHVLLVKPIRHLHCTGNLLGRGVPKSTKGERKVSHTIHHNSAISSWKSSPPPNREMGGRHKRVHMQTNIFNHANCPEHLRVRRNI